MNKSFKKFIAFTVCATAGIHCINRIINYTATLKNLLDSDKGNYYNWKNGDIFYTVSGSGTPILLVHDLHPASSSVEWSKVIKKLEKNHKVYCLDILGCGRSDKPAITYTSYLFVQMINDFVKNVIKEETTLVATGASASFAIMTNIMNPENFKKVIVVNPENLSNLMSQPDKKKVLCKYVMDCPIFGTFFYNMKMNQNNIEKMLQRKCYSNNRIVPTKITETYFEAAHLGNEKGRHLLSSICADYTNVNVGHAIPKIKNLCIIGSRERANNMKIIDEYTRSNSTIETASVSFSKYLPQLEVPEKFYDVLNMFLNK